MSALPNPDLLYRIPLTARTVLDVGCNTGALGAAYRQMNPAARIYGIAQRIIVCMRWSGHTIYS